MSTTGFTGWNDCHASDLPCLRKNEPVPQNVEEPRFSLQLVANQAPATRYTALYAKNLASETGVQREVRENSVTKIPGTSIFQEKLFRKKRVQALYASFRFPGTPVQALWTEVTCKERRVQRKSITFGKKNDVQRVVPHFRGVQKEGTRLVRSSRGTKFPGKCLYREFSERFLGVQRVVPRFRIAENWRTTLVREFLGAENWSKRLVPSFSGVLFCSRAVVPEFRPTSSGWIASPAKLNCGFR
ncbi:MAG: hypothetical protein JWM68_3988 [Verrucomicrobiales bacterium]|nr:hypothetical protein [Verrucomicrobiales bacterium]